MGVQPGAFIINADPGLKSVVSEQLVKSLGDHYADFVKAFYYTRNILYKEAFNKYWQELIVNFSEFAKYLLRQLDPCKTTWAKAFIETQLYILFKRIETRVAEDFVGQFATWHEKMTLYITLSIPSQLFSNIYKIGDLNNLTLDTVDNRSIEFEYNFCQIYLNEHLDGIDQSLITKVWEVKSIKNKLHVGQHIVLLNNTFAESWNSALTEPLVQTAAKAIGQKQSIKGTLLGLACKCNGHIYKQRSQHYTNVIYNHNTKYVQMGKLNVKQDHIMEDNDQIMDAKYDQIIDDDEGSEILEDEVVKNDQIAEITPLDILDPFRYIGKG
ncbi:22190_t:CDS:2, partial [Gigaspora margarita]